MITPMLKILHAVLFGLVAGETFVWFGWPGFGMVLGAYALGVAEIIIQCYEKS